MANRAKYENPRGFHLWLVFDPLDANAAFVLCGRRWTAGDREFGLSCYYADLASRFDLVVPRQYTFDSRKGIEVVTEMLSDLQRTLREILAKVTLDDLVKCEERQFTARHGAELAFGPGYRSKVKISEFT